MHKTKIIMKIIKIIIATTRRATTRRATTINNDKGHEQKNRVFHGKQSILSELVSVFDRKTEKYNHFYTYYYMWLPHIDINLFRFSFLKHSHQFLTQQQWQQNIWFVTNRFSVCFYECFKALRSSFVFATFFSLSSSSLYICYYLYFYHHEENVFCLLFTHAINFLLSFFYTLAHYALNFVSVPFAPFLLLYCCLFSNTKYIESYCYF